MRELADDTILSRVLANGDTSAFVPSTDGLQPVRDVIGVPANMDSGGATLSDNLKKMADDNGGATFDAGTDSLNKIREIYGSELVEKTEEQEETQRLSA